MIYLHLDASLRRLFKQIYSSADLMHGPISKSDHSAVDSNTMMKSTRAKYILCI